MFHAVLPNGDILCSRYELGDHGATLYTDDEEFVAFVPYENLVAIVDSDAEMGSDRSVA